MRSSTTTFPAFAFSTFIIGPIACLACVVLSAPSVDANEPLAALIRNQAIELNVASQDLRNEIKLHFRGTRGYRNLLAVNGRLTSRSASIIKRIEREPEYRALEKDVAKLNKYAGELSVAYEIAMQNSSDGRGQPVAGNTVHVIDKLTNITALADQIKAASLGVDTASISFREAEIVPNPNFAPSVLPRREEVDLRLNHEQPALEGPTTSGPESAMRSVLVK